MTLLPYVEWGLHDRGVEVELTLTPAPHFPAPRMDEVRAILELFHVLGDAGMLSSTDPARSSFAPRDAAGSYRARQVDAGAFRMLLNALEHALGHDLHALGLSIRSVTSGAPTLVHMRELQAIAYPGQLARLPFELEDNLTDPLRRHMIVRAEFSDPMADETLEYAGVRLAAWQQALSLGAYVDPGQRVGPAFTHADWYRISMHAAEYSVFNCTAPFEATHLVLNLLAHVHWRVAAVAAVECE